MRTLSMVAIALIAFSSFAFAEETHCWSAPGIGGRPFQWCHDFTSYSIAIQKQTPPVTEQARDQAPAEMLPMIDYLLSAPEMRCYGVLIRSFDGVEEVTIGIDVSIKVRDNWLTGTWVKNGTPVTPRFRLGPDSRKSKSGMSFLMLIAFPRLLPDGSEWKDKDVSDMKFSGTE